MKNGRGGGREREKETTKKNHQLVHFPHCFVALFVYDISLSVHNVRRTDTHTHTHTQTEGGEKQKTGGGRDAEMERQKQREREGVG